MPFPLYSVSGMSCPLDIPSALFKIESKIEGLFYSTETPRRRVFVGSVDSRDEEELVFRRYSNPLPPETTIVKTLSFSPIAA